MRSPRVPTFCRLGLGVVLFFLAACGVDPESLPDVPAPPRVGREMEDWPLDKVKLVIASADGNTAVIEELRTTSEELDWERDGAAALKYAARAGHEEVVTMLLGYGACRSPDSEEPCAAALEEAKRHDHTEIVRLLELARGR